MAIRNILETSRKFGVKPDDVFRYVSNFKGLGFTEGTISRVLETSPRSIILNEAEIRNKVDLLTKIGVHRGEIDRIFCSFPGILAFGVQNRLKPLLDEFRHLGFSPNEVRREVVREPKVLGLENGELSHCVEMLRTLKCRAAIKDQIFRNGEFRAGYEAKLRIDCLRKHGLIYRDAFTVLWKEPRVIIYEVGDIEKKIAFLVNTMKFDVRCIVEVPEYLGVNFEKQIVPRFNVIEYLRSSDGLGDEVGLRNLVKMSRLRFYNMYVKPYPECERMYGRFCGDVVVGNGNRNRSQHPIGMWKLFKPEPYPESDDDVGNIKLYMESLHQDNMEHCQGVKKVEKK
ncbi:hypothetical protein ABFS82_12G115500 [Erythranthe guttata]|nr:PREDICTED: uncharacterized protein LOC105964848 [Erythranthe guttata]|eukprot:XP_012844817.1 PREDICTED: uncharacterized protein LOC105964848 [Erythranthe guttata]